MTELDNLPIPAEKLRLDLSSCSHDIWILYRISHFPDFTKETVPDEGMRNELKRYADFMLGQLEELWFEMMRFAAEGIRGHYYYTVNDDYNIEVWFDGKGYVWPSGYWSYADEMSLPLDPANLPFGGYGWQSCYVYTLWTDDEYYESTGCMILEDGRNFYELYVDRIHRAARERLYSIPLKIPEEMPEPDTDPYA